MRPIPIAALFFLVATFQALADAAHTHKPKAGVYTGHAADLGEPGDPKARNIRTIEIVMTDQMRFQPAQITITRGQTVKLVVKNAGETKHEFILGTPDELIKHAAAMEKFPEMEHDDPNALSVEPGKTGTLYWKFTKSGVWEIGYACLLPGHFTAGMKGKLAVY
ncbi:MAG: hypothetical protein EXQ91_03270 [Alphaproteobacteria bacterium]|nr:hypothetical protein [Alphaproteobacteria bacterium]